MRGFGCRPRETMLRRPQRHFLRRLPSTRTSASTAPDSEKPSGGLRRAAGKQSRVRFDTLACTPPFPPFTLACDHLRRDILTRLYGRILTDKPPAWKCSCEPPKGILDSHMPYSRARLLLPWQCLGDLQPTRLCTKLIQTCTMT